MEITLVHGPKLGWRDQIDDMWFRRITFVAFFVLGWTIGRLDILNGRR